METLFTMKDLQAMSRFSRSLIYKHIEQGLLAKPLKVGRISRWKKSDVEQWLDNLSQQAQE